MVNPNLHVWCFRVAPPGPSLYGATEGSASEAADVRLESLGLSRGLSAAAESAFPEGAIASILRDASGAKVARLRREFQLLGVNLPLQGRRGPREEEVCTFCGRRWRVEGEETDGRGHPNTQAPRLLWCLASRHEYSYRPWHTGGLEGFLKAQAH